MKNSTRNRILEMTWDVSDRYQYEASKMAYENLDMDAMITFAGKHFVLSGYGDDVYGEEAKLIASKGGIIHGSMVKCADYLLVNIKFCGRGKLEKALEWRKKGSNVKIVCNEMFEETLSDDLEQSNPTLDTNEKEVDIGDTSIGLQEGWTRIPTTLTPVEKLRGRFYHDLNQYEYFKFPVYFRGPIAQIRKLMTCYDASEFIDVGNGIGQIAINNSYKEGKKLQQIIRQFPCLRCTGFSSESRIQSVFLSDSGYDVISHVHVLDTLKNEGLHWIYYADVLKDGDYFASDSRVDVGRNIHYTFPYQELWYSDRYVVEENGKHYLYWPSNGESVTVPEGTTKVDSQTYSRNALVKRMIISEGVTIIEERAFMDCSQLVEVQLPNSLEKIGDYAFKNCKNLNSIHLPDGVVELGQGIFEGCQELTEVHLPTMIERIPEDAFRDCIKLKKVNLPANLISIAENAFTGCKKLSSIMFPQKLRSIESHAFSYCKALFNRKEHILPDSLEFVGDCAFGEDPYANSNSGLKISHLPLHLKQAGIQTFASAFCENCTELTLSSSLTQIGKKAFQCNTFQRLRIEPGLRVISREAFRGCINLWRVDIEGDLLETIEREAFVGCTPLLYIVVPNKTKVDSFATDGTCNILHRKDVPNASSLLSELKELQNARVIVNSFAELYPFVFLLSDCILDYEADALIAMLRLGMLTDEKMMRRYWKAISFAELPLEQRNKLSLIKKNWKQLIPILNDPKALDQYLIELLV